MAKTYTFVRTKSRTGETYETRPMTIDEAVEYYSYTLEKGAAWQHEQGNKKINRNPKSAVALVKNLNNAVNNAAANGYAGETYSVI
jgi:ribosomal protein L22